MLEIKNLCRSYMPKKGVPVKALDDVSLRIEDKGMVFILGKSGSGKSTLLNVLGGLDKYDSGELIICNKSSKDFSQSDFDSYRNTYIGFIFQEYNILDEFTVGQNIALAMQLQGKKATSEALNAIMEQVDLQGYENRKPNELSGGQKQRVAIARALIKDPQIIMADEPTGALDSNTGKQVFDTLKKLSKDKLVLIVSHDRDFAEIYADRIIEFADGKVVSDNTKYIAPAIDAGEGIKVVDNKIIQIKKGYTLTAKDLKVINDYLSNNGNDTIISMDSKSNSEIKRIAKLTEAGDREAFKDTTADDVVTKDYAEGDFQTIKSKLPLKNSLKMAASSLKTKPVRLFLTILLSAIAFAMFGLIATFAFYDKTTTAAQSIIDNGTDYISFSKTEETEEYTSTSYITNADITALQAKFPDLDFIPVFNGTNSSYINLGFSNNIKKVSDMGAYYAKTFSGAAEITQQQIDNMGYSLEGNLPAADNEIVITKYAYQHFEKGGYTSNGITHAIDIDLVTMPSQIIGQSLYFNNYQYKIVGILDTKLDDSKYDTYKEPSTSLSSDLPTMFKQMAMSADINDSFAALVFVNTGYVQKLIGNVNIISTSGYGSTYHNMTIEVPAADDRDVQFLKVLPFSKSATGDYATTGSTSISGFTMVAPYSAINNEVIRMDGESTVTLDNIVSTNMRNSIEALTVPTAFDKTVAINLKTTANYLIEIDESNPTVSEIKNCYICYLTDETRGWIENAYASETGKELFIRLRSAAIEKAVQDNAADIDALRLKLSSITNSWSGNTSTTDVKDNPVTIVGVVYPKYNNLTPSIGSLEDANYDSNDDYWIMADATINSLGFKSTGIYSMLLAKMPTSTDDVKALVDFGYTTDADGITFSLDNPSTAMLNWVNSLIETLSTVFLYVGIGFAVFAAFLLMNFIATSISYKKREIGILRAVGARGADVFGIFFNESLMIALINFVIALAMTIATVVSINKVVINAGIAISVLNFGILQILIMLAISIGVAFIASFLPVYKVALKRPIDAIRDK